ncbi:hypothetical protein RJ55_05620 [Drechmeria coniospora]|nr:hypothetical protein RJ55_05620 [Drechmeria coniospora]
MVLPTCSNCLLYKAECRTSIARRRGVPPRTKPTAGVPPEPPTPPGPAAAGTVEGRLSRIERQLQRIIRLSAAATEPRRAPTDLLPPADEDDDASRTDRRPSTSTPLTSLRPSSASLPSADELPLPPAEEIMPIVDHYFSVFSLVVPLFDRASFVALLDRWYREDDFRRDRAAWAAIQVVLALALRTPTPDGLQDGSGAHRFRAANLYLGNAQSVLSELVTRDRDLLGIQVLLGLVLLFQNSSDTKPASVIIGTAVRLAHRLRLHSQDSVPYFTPEENLQRSRVFWIAYALDKVRRLVGPPARARARPPAHARLEDISLRIKAPSVQMDADIDVPLPSLTVSDGAGLLWTPDGLTHINFHRLRVDLAHVEGQVYDQLYSNRSTKAPPDERRRRAADLQRQLEHWYRRIPTAFRVEHVASTLKPCEVIMMTKMHYAYLLATLNTHGLHGNNADWFARCASPDADELRAFVRAMDAHTSAAPLPGDDADPRFVGAWSHCVELSRACMKLFEQSPPTECLVWQCCCPHMSALTTLLANLLVNPTHEFVSLDQHLATRAVQLFDSLIELAPSESVQKIRNMAGDLYGRAFEAVAKSTASADADADDVGNLGFDPNAFTSLTEWMTGGAGAGELIAGDPLKQMPHFPLNNFDSPAWDGFSPMAQWAPLYDPAGTVPTGGPIV